MKILEEKVNGKEIKLLEASGWNDGYYWDMNATFEYDGDIYHVYDGGSGSGYILCCSGITKDAEWNREFGEEQTEFRYDDDIEEIERMVYGMLDDFIESGATKSLEYEDDDHFETHKFIDEKEVEIE